MMAINTLKGGSCLQQLTVLFFVQFKELFSLREMESTLKAQSDKWHHIGLKTVAGSTLADANRERPHQIWGDQEFGLPDLPPDSILTADRGYIDYRWLYSLHCKGTTFIVRAKSNMTYDDLGQHEVANRKKGILSDEVIELSNEYKYEDYPETLRLIRILDQKKGTTIDVLTNNFKLSASKIAELYKGRAVSLLQCR